MSVIVYRDGIMAADSRAYCGANHAFGRKSKIARLDDGTLYGCTSGQTGVAPAVMGWFAEGRPEGAKGLKERLCMVDDPRFSLLAVGPDRVGMLFIGYGLPTTAWAGYYAIGSAEEYALGALAMGASAVDAVRACCRLDSACAEPIDNLTHEGLSAVVGGPMRQRA